MHRNRYLNNIFNYELITADSTVLPQIEVVDVSEDGSMVPEAEVTIFQVNSNSNSTTVGVNTSLIRVLSIHNFTSWMPVLRT